MFVYLVKCCPSEQPKIRSCLNTTCNMVKKREKSVLPAVKPVSTQKVQYIPPIYLQSASVLFYRALSNQMNQSIKTPVCTYKNVQNKLKQTTYLTTELLTLPHIYHKKLAK